MTVDDYGFKFMKVDCVPHCQAVPSLKKKIRHQTSKRHLKYPDKFEILLNLISGKILDF